MGRCGFSVMKLSLLFMLKGSYSVYCCAGYAAVLELFPNDFLRFIQ